MAVVIRLQGLPAIAGSVDIRHFFSGLNIPDGGVHIIGGKTGEAFIIFATDEDARRAVARSNGIIKNSHVHLFLSSKTEMQNTLEMSRRSSRKHPVIPPGNDTFGAKIGNRNKFDKGLSASGLDNSGTISNKVYNPKFEKRQERTSEEADSVYVFLYGLPYSATHDDIREFFSGLDVVDSLFILRQNGSKNGNAVVKFGRIKDANAALCRNNDYMGVRFICIKKTTEIHWIRAGGQVGGGMHSKQPRKQRSRSRSPLNQQLYLRLKNLSYNVEEQDVKNFLGFPDLPNSQIKFLVYKNGHRTRQCFIVVKNEWQFVKCLSLHKNGLNGRPVLVYPILRKEMLDLIESYENRLPPKMELTDFYQKRDHTPIKRCIYLRNFPFDVTKAEILRFFAEFPVHEDDVFLLFDSSGVGLGEALVRFPTEQQALLAEGLNRQRFLDTEILLRRISDDQVKEFSIIIDKPLENVLAHSPVYSDEDNVCDSVEQSFALHNDLAYGHGNFRGSPERLHGSNPLDFLGHQELAGNFDRGSQSNIDFHHSLPFHRQRLEGRSPAVVGMKNVPYKATIEEILDFFYGYNIIRDSIDVKFTKDGMARGLATVVFESYDEAVAAVNELNEKPIGTRKIILSLIN